MCAACSRASDADDTILLWGGGIWHWLDPLTVIRAVQGSPSAGRMSGSCFMGLRRPNAAVADDGDAGPRDRAGASELGVRDRLVVFNEGWVPYEERGAWLARGRRRRLGALRRRRGPLRLPHAPARLLLGGASHGDDAATNSVTSSSERGLERRVPAGDVDAWAAALCRARSTPLTSRSRPCARAVGPRPTSRGRRGAATRPPGARAGPDGCPAPPAPALLIAVRRDASCEVASRSCTAGSSRAWAAPSGTAPGQRPVASGAKLP